VNSMATNYREARSWYVYFSSITYPRFTSSRFDRCRTANPGSLRSVLATRALHSAQALYRILLSLYYYDRFGRCDLDD
jgi:hypothetical protein